MNEVVFVEFELCNVCGTPTDLFCVSCDGWFCSSHMDCCVQCDQPVCEECYKEDICCFVRPWGEKTELHLKSFYENKIVDSKGMATLSVYVRGRSNGDESKWNNVRRDVLKRSVKHFVDDFDTSFTSGVHGIAWAFLESKSIWMMRIAVPNSFAS